MQETKPESYTCYKCAGGGADVHWCLFCKNWLCLGCFGNDPQYNDNCRNCETEVETIIKSEQTPPPDYSNHPTEQGWPPDLVAALQQQVVAGGGIPGQPVPTKNDTIRDVVVELTNSVIDHFNDSTLPERLNTVFLMLCGCICMVPAAIGASFIKIDNIKAKREEAIPGFQILKRPVCDEQTSDPA